MLGLPDVINPREFWNIMFQKMLTRLNFLRLYLFPLIGQIWCINIFVLSKVVFHDQFCPIPNDLANKFMDDIRKKLKSINGNSLMRNEILYAPLNSGGFRLMSLTTKGKGTLAKRIYHLCTTISFSRTYIFSKLQQYYLNNGSEYLQTKYKALSVIFQPLAEKITNEIEEEMRLLKIDTLPPLVHSFLGALRPKSRARPRLLTMIHDSLKEAFKTFDELFFWKDHKDEQGVNDPNFLLILGNKVFNPVGEIDLSECFSIITEEKVDPTSFIRFYKHFGEKYQVISSHHPHHYLPPSSSTLADHLKFWHGFSRLRRIYPRAEESLHRAILHQHLNYGKMARWLANNTDAVNTSPTCALCCTNTDTTHHRFFECSCSKKIFKFLLPHHTFSFDTFISIWHSTIGFKLAVYCLIIEEISKFYRFNHNLNEHPHLRHHHEYIMLEFAREVLHEKYDSDIYRKFYSKMSTELEPD